MALSRAQLSQRFLQKRPSLALSVPQIRPFKPHLPSSPLQILRQPSPSPSTLLIRRLYSSLYPSYIAGTLQASLLTGDGNRYRDFDAQNCEEGRNVQEAARFKGAGGQRIN